MIDMELGFGIIVTGSALKIYKRDSRNSKFRHCMSEMNPTKAS